MEHVVTQGKVRRLKINWCRYEELSSLNEEHHLRYRTTGLRGEVLIFRVMGSTYGHTEIKSL